jgi:hypothetical protein
MASSVDTPNSEQQPSIAPAALSKDVRRCFVCLMDEGESGSSTSEWVNPCPCTLEAHQDCMMDWVANEERDRKELKCPVCKAAINVDGPWDPAVALSEAMYRGLSRVSPFMIFGCVATGGWIGLATYGHVAISTFAGNEATVRFLIKTTRDGVTRLNWVHLAWLPLIGPSLIIGHSFPRLSNAFALPAAGLVSGRSTPPPKKKKKKDYSC